MLINEISAGNAWKVKNRQGDFFEIIPRNSGYVAFNNQMELEFKDARELGMFLDQQDLKPVSTTEESKSNAYALTGSGRFGKNDSKAHKKVRTPDTTYSKTRKKYNHGAKPGAKDGFVG